MKLMSFNIRCICDKGEEAWEKRRPRLLELVRAEAPELIGFQEVTHPQLLDLVAGLAGYDYEGIGRDDGVNAGEYAAIFYRSDRFEKLDVGHFWLSETPDKPSMGWDAVCIRMCTYVRLRDRQSGKEFCHFNTHLDHVGRTAMLKGAEMICKKALSCGIPALVTGDFNVTEGSDPYKALVGGGLIDAKYNASASMSCGTFHGYNPSPNIAIQSPIDYIFHTPGDFKVERYSVVINGGVGAYSSDHYPITAILEVA